MNLLDKVVLYIFLLHYLLEKIQVVVLQLVFQLVLLLLQRLQVVMLVLQLMVLLRSPFSTHAQA